MMFCDVGRRKAGFTLIEIMIVIAIIAILAGIVVPNIAASRIEANIAGCHQNILSLAKSMDMYLVRHTYLDLWKRGVEHTNASTGVQVLIEDGYLDKVPVCPFKERGFGRDCYRILLASALDPPSNCGYIVKCMIGNGRHKRLDGSYVSAKYMVGYDDFYDRPGGGWDTTERGEEPTSPL